MTDEAQADIIARRRAEPRRVLGLRHHSVCAHGSLKRQCELCERDAEIAELRSKLEGTDAMYIALIHLRDAYEALLAAAREVAEADNALGGGRR